MKINFRDVSIVVIVAAIGITLVAYGFRKEVEIAASVALLAGAAYLSTFAIKIHRVPGPSDARYIRTRQILLAALWTAVLFILGWAGSYAYRAMTGKREHWTFEILVKIGLPLFLLALAKYAERESNRNRSL